MPSQLRLEARADLPAWSALPAKNRDEAVRLVARMLGDYVTRRRGGRREVSDE